MKKKSFLIFFCLTAVVSVFLSCRNAKDEVLLNNDFSLKHVDLNFAVQFQRTAENTNFLDLLDEHSSKVLLNMVNGDYSGSRAEYIKLQNFQLDGNKDYYYLIFEGYNKKTKKISRFAYPIRLNDDMKSATFLNRSEAPQLAGGLNASLVDGDVHKCTGDPCTCCAFSRNDQGQIIGCLCQGVFMSSTCPVRLEQKCNHEVTSDEPTAYAYQQCGGIGYSGPTICEAGYRCVVQTAYFSQCLP